jgi:hypothetical protein
MSVHDFIDLNKLDEIRKLIKELSNHHDEYIIFEIEIGCHGKEEIDEYPDDYEGDAILNDGECYYKFELYCSHYRNGFYEFHDLDSAINYLKNMQIIKNRPKLNMMAAQNAIGESDANN